MQIVFGLCSACEDAATTPVLRPIDEGAPDATRENGAWQGPGTPDAEKKRKEEEAAAAVRALCHGAWFMFCGRIVRSRTNLVRVLRLRPACSQ